MCRRRPPRRLSVFDVIFLALLELVLLVPLTLLRALRLISTCLAAPFEARRHHAELVRWHALRGALAAWGAKHGAVPVPTAAGDAEPCAARALDCGAFRVALAPRPHRWAAFAPRLTVTLASADLVPMVLTEIAPRVRMGGLRSAVAMRLGPRAYLAQCSIPTRAHYARWEPDLRAPLPALFRWLRVTACAAVVELEAPAPGDLALALDAALTALAAVPGIAQRAS